MVCLGVCAALGPCRAALRLWLCVYLRRTHSLVVRRPKHDSLAATLRLWKQREIDLECERGEVKVLYTEGWVGLKLQTGGWPCFHSVDETKQRQTGLNSKQMSLFSPALLHTVYPSFLKCSVCSVYYFPTMEKETHWWRFVPNIVGFHQ